jgi:hypothetical protein
MKMDTEEGRVVDSGISLKHAKDWTIGEAVREVVQNWLDVKNEFSCKGEIVYNKEKGYAYFLDKGPGLQIGHLAFGNNDKAEGSIGQFGEGLKSAMVTLVRNSRKVDIRSLGKVIVPFVQVSENFGVETLHYRITDAKTVGIGTLIRVYCTEEEFQTGKNYFTALQPHIEWIEANRISLPGGNIYVNGSRIGRVDNALFSYHLTRDEAGTIINRDRNAVDLNKAGKLVREIINNTRSLSVAKEILQAAVGEKANENHWEIGLNIYSMNDSIWLEAFHKIWGKTYVRSSGDMETDQQAVYRGYNIIPHLDYTRESLLGSFGIPNSAEILQKVASKQRKVNHTVKHSDLTPTERENLSWVKRTVKEYYAEPGTVFVSTNLNEETGNVNGNVQGCWDPKKERIGLLRSILSDRKVLLHVLLHETVHKVSGCNDITHEFEDALLAVAVNIIMK